MIRYLYAWGPIWTAYIAGLIMIVVFIRKRMKRDAEIIALLTEIRDRLPRNQADFSEL